jgi:hypothetical protein
VMLWDTRQPRAPLRVLQVGSRVLGFCLLFSSWRRLVCCRCTLPRCFVWELTGIGLYRVARITPSELQHSQSKQ